MSGKPTSRFRVRRYVAAGSAVCLIAVSSAPAQKLEGLKDLNLSNRSGDENECTISRNPNDSKKLFAACACSTSAAGLFVARSSDGGEHWESPPGKMIANVKGEILMACCDPSSAWDSFGNLFLTYIDYSRSFVEILRSTDDGNTFSQLKAYKGSVDQPTVAVSRPSPGGSGAVWVVWAQGEPQDQGDPVDQMVAVGAPVTALGVGPFGDLQRIPGMTHCSFGDVGVSPKGSVAVTCQTPTGDQGPTKILVSTDRDGLGTQQNFLPAVQAATTNVGGVEPIPAQFRRRVDAEAGLAFDASGSPRSGRLYLIYSEETPPDKHDLHVMLKYSDDNGVKWKPEQPIRVSDDAGGKSQFLPRVAVDSSSGSISVCWYDCRNSSENTAMQVYCTTASPADSEPRFAAGVAISDVPSSGNGVGFEYGDYSGLTYADGILFPIWVDTSTSPSTNLRDRTFEVMTDRASENKLQVGDNQKPPETRTPGRHRRPPKRPGH